MNIYTTPPRDVSLSPTSTTRKTDFPFNFEQWALAVRKQMESVVTKKLILPSTYRKSDFDQNHESKS